MFFHNDNLNHSAFRYVISSGNTPQPGCNLHHQDFFIGNSYKPCFATVTGWGVDAKYIPSGSIRNLTLVKTSSKQVGSYVVKRTVSVQDSGCPYLC